jgi:hypothetical protein
MVGGMREEIMNETHIETTAQLMKNLKEKLNNGERSLHFSLIAYGLEFLLLCGDGGSGKIYGTRRAGCSFRNNFTSACLLLLQRHRMKECFMLSIIAAAIIDSCGASSSSE